MDLENTGIAATMTVRGMNRFHFRPWGLNSGAAGRLGEVMLNPDRPDARSIGKINVLHLARGDSVRITTPAGGGFGNPLDRDVEAVRADVIDRVMTRQHAYDIYGVVVTGNDEIDIEATGARRDELARGYAVSNSLFTTGPEREAYDRLWPDRVRSALARRALAVDPTLRQHLISQVRATLSAEGQPATLAKVDAAIADVLDRCGKVTNPRDRENQVEQARKSEC
jgi:N-methylhydantoinase B